MGNTVDVQVGDDARLKLLTEYDAWHAQRQVFGTRDEGTVNPTQPDDWHGSDDTAVGLLHEVMSALRATSECGHGSADAVADNADEDAHTVTCSDCGMTWSVKG